MKAARPPTRGRMEKQLELIIESLLFAADKPLRVRDIQVCLPETGLPEIEEALETLRHEYDTMDRSFALKEVAEGYQIRTKPDYAPHVLRMTKRSAARLSTAAMENPGDHRLQTTGDSTGDRTIQGCGYRRNSENTPGKEPDSDYGPKTSSRPAVDLWHNQEVSGSLRSP